MNKKVLTSLLVAVFLVGTLAAAAGAASVTIYEDASFDTPASSLEFGTWYFVKVKHEETDNTNMPDQYYADVVTVTTRSDDDSTIDMFESDPEAGDTSNGNFTFSFKLEEDNTSPILEENDVPGDPGNTPYIPRYIVNTYPGASLKFCYSGTGDNTAGTDAWPDDPELPLVDVANPPVCTDEYSFDATLELTGENTGSALNEVGDNPWETTEQPLGDNLDDIYDPNGSTVLDVLVQDWSGNTTASVDTLTNAITINGTQYSLTETGASTGLFTLDGDVSSGHVTVDFDDFGTFGSTFSAEYHSAGLTEEGSIGLPIRAYNDGEVTDDDIGEEGEFKHSYLFFQAIEDPGVTPSTGIDTTGGFTRNLYEVTDDYDATLGGSEDFPILIDEGDTYLKPAGDYMPTVDARGADWDESTAINHRIFLIQESDVTVEGFEVIGDSETYSGIEVTIDYLAGESDIYILANHVHGMAKPDPVDVNNSFGIIATWGDDGVSTLNGIEIAGNEVNDIGGGTVRGVGISLEDLIETGTVFDSDYAAFVVDNYIHDIHDKSTGTDDNDLGVGLAVAADSVGSATGDASDAANALVFGNVFEENYADVVVGGTTGTHTDPDPNNEYPRIVGNDFGSGSVGVYNGTTDSPINAELNWWGSKLGPTVGDNDDGDGDAIQGDGTNDEVLYRPWINAAPMDPAGFNDADDIPNFWDPDWEGNKTVHNTNDGEHFWTISGALDADNFTAGDTIEVGDGTYTNDLETRNLVPGPLYSPDIQKSVTIKAASSPILELETNDPIAILPAGEDIDVTLEGFTIDSDVDLGVFTGNIPCEDDYPAPAVPEDYDVYMTYDLVPLVYVSDYTSEGTTYDADLTMTDTDITNHDSSQAIGLWVHSGEEEYSTSATLKGVTVQKTNLGIMVGGSASTLTMDKTEGGDWNVLKDNGYLGLLFDVDASGSTVEYTKFLRNGTMASCEGCGCGGALLAANGDNEVHNSIFRDNAEGLTTGTWDYMPDGEAADSGDASPQEIQPGSGTVDWVAVGNADPEDTVLDATNNYWGASSGPYNAVSNPDGEGQRIDDNIAFEPYWTDTCTIHELCRPDSPSDQLHSRHHFSSAYRRTLIHTYTHSTPTRRWFS
ncbi:hypothetical protein KGY71_00185 [Candidatus Bipolaricaulota bacterium]|nr:hypothetical protein [Candidatus Bipolaricaulota bacterium]MBS3792404.1 hypothetical protein [Candidatus Bipolaricaulota bacterium]